MKLKKRISSEMWNIKCKCCKNPAMSNFYGNWLRQQCFDVL